MAKYDISGMSCAACSARVEKAVKSVEGVTSCDVNLLTNSMNVEGDVSSETVISAVENAGYGAALISEKNKGDGVLADSETPAIKKRLIVSIVLLLPLMYLSMGHVMHKLPIPEFLDNAIIIGVLQMLLTLAIIVLNKRFFTSGFKALIHRAPNMDTLVAVGSGASFIYSLGVIILIINDTVDGAPLTAMSELYRLHFESAATILVFITVGKLLEAYSKGRTTDAIKGLMSLTPDTAVVERDGKEVTVPVDEVKKGDIFIVRSGESIPVDGVIIEGDAAVDESALTGESIPVDKTAGDSVSGATINSSGFIKCEAKRVGEDTTISKIIELVSEASSTKAPVARIADRVSGVFVPIVFAIAAVTLAVWLIAGHAFGYSLSRAITVLVISCPCALGLATPVAIMVGNGLGAKNGILFKTATSLEETGKTQIVALDKTGTITKGEPKVTDVIPLSCDEEKLVSTAYSLEKKSEHPLAKAIVEYAEERGAKALESESFKTLSGSGVSAEIGGESCFGGSVKFISEKTNFSDDIKEKTELLASEGKTPLAFTCGEKLLGIIAVADVVKEDSAEAVKQLRNMGIKVVMLTGDNKRTAEAIGAETGVDLVVSELMPSDKERIIKELSEFGRVAMVGDGINDAPALTRADIGIAINAGADIAIDAADVVLMNSNLRDVPAAIRLSRATLRNIHENLFWAFIYNVIGISLATGMWKPLTGWVLTPMYGAAAMSLSSLCVVSNALRLNLFKCYNAKRDKKRESVEISIQREDKENKAMTKTIGIEGMMCPHCEATVKKALEAIDGVENAVPSHEENRAVVTLSKEVDDAVLTKAVEDKDYIVKSIE